MILKPKRNININNDYYYWLLTEFIVLGIENNCSTLSNDQIKEIDEIKKIISTNIGIDKLINFHEKLENYEICEKLLTYKKLF